MYEGDILAWDMPVFAVYPHMKGSCFSSLGFMFFDIIGRLIVHQQVMVIIGKRF